MPIALIEPGESSYIPYLALYLFGSLVQGAGSIVPPSLLSDVIDYDIYKTGTNRAASYLSLTTLLFKANIAIGSALAFYLLSFFDFDVNALSQTSNGTLGAWLTALFIPGTLFVLAGVLLWFFPIDNRRASTIVKWIERRARRLEAGNTKT
jgi:Na+/melibiose symporter-like transporter